MADLNARMERAIEEMAGNEALLEMLETDAAKEMLHWGIATAKSVISRTREIDDFAVELAILPAHVVGKFDDLTLSTSEFEIADHHDAHQLPRGIGIIVHRIAEPVSRAIDHHFDFAFP